MENEMQTDGIWVFIGLRVYEILFLVCILVSVYRTP